jgi:hypothetical protein
MEPSPTNATSPAASSWRRSASVSSTALTWRHTAAPSWQAYTSPSSTQLAFIQKE